MFAARLEVVKEDRAIRAAEVISVIEGYRAKRFTREDGRRIVKLIAGQDLMTELTPADRALYEESKRRAEEYARKRNGTR